MMQYKVVFELFQKLHDINIQLSFVLLNLESVERSKKKLQKLEYISRELKELFR